MPRGHQDFGEGVLLARASPQAGDPQRTGHYRLTDRLGSGGMGVVYLGVSQTGGTAARFAVEVLRAELPPGASAGVTGIDSAQAQVGRQVVLCRVPAG